MLENWAEISIYQTDLIKSLAIFYLIVFSNFVTNLFTCYQTRIIVNSKLLQYLLGFFLFYFLVTIDLIAIPPIQKFIYTIVYYLFFITLYNFVKNLYFSSSFWLFVSHNIF